MFDQIAILAPGLLGASVARAARHYGVAKRIALWARRPEARLQLKNQSWCDRVADSAIDAVQGAELIVICTPVDQIVPLTSQIASHLSAGAIVTDVGSVKGEICRLGDKALRPPASAAHFVGSHPMAGSAQTGWEQGRVDLFVGRVTFVTPLPDTDPKSIERVIAFWTALESVAATVDPDKHDEIVAHISHLPQIIASTLCASLAKKDARWRNYSGGGLRDTTRIAASDPKLWETILEQNRDEVLRALRDYQEELHGMERALANRDWLEVQAIMERGKAYRDQFRPIP